MFGKLISTFKGHGNKTMMLFGNSHAEYGIIGIERVFRDLYSEFTTIMTQACVPFTARMQASWPIVVK